MVGTFKNWDGFLLGYIEWNVLDKNGQFGSEYIYVSDIWIHHKYKRTKIFKDLIKIIDTHPFAKDARYVYWDVAKDDKGRRIYDDTRKDFITKQSRIYDRKYIADKIIGKGIRLCLK